MSSRGTALADSRAHNYCPIRCEHCRLSLLSTRAIQVTLAPAPLHSRFGRRLLLLFVGCAVLPIALVAAVSYGTSTAAPEPDRAAAAPGQQGAGHSRSSSACCCSTPPSGAFPPRVHRAGSGGAARLEPAAAITGLDLLASRRFVALEFVGDDGVASRSSARSRPAPVADPAQPARPRGSAFPLLAIRHGDGQASADLHGPAGRAPDARLARAGLLVGEVSAEFLWAYAGDQSMPSATTSSR